MRIIYSAVLYLLTPLLLLRLWWKGRRLPAYRQRIAERFCLGGATNKKSDIWIHAVSLGEVIAATPLIDALLDKQWSVLVTTMTPTGSQRVITRFGNRVAHHYVPYDLPGVLKRFFRKAQPRVGIIMETELWPNLVNQASKAKVPLLLANARLSERSLQGYRKLKFLFKPVLNQFSVIMAQSTDDGERFKILGARSAIVHVAGNIKFDLQIDADVKNRSQEFKQYWGTKRPVVIAASTHEGEEALILAALHRLKKAIPDVLLLIAPRHPERFESVFQLSQHKGFSTGLRSRINAIQTHHDVIVLDSLGELLDFYALSDFAFVGGSLVPVGGHNVLEPIALDVPVFSGHYMHNFKTISQDLAAAQAIKLIKDADELMDLIIELYNNSEERVAMVVNARGVLDRNKGALQRHVEQIENLIGVGP